MVESRTYEHELQEDEMALWSIGWFREVRWQYPIEPPGDVTLLRFHKAGVLKTSLRDVVLSSGS